MDGGTQLSAAANTDIVKNQIVNCRPNRTQTGKMGADMLPKNGQKRQIALKPIAHATVWPDTNSEKMVHQLNHSIKHD